jgi:hypothetical protein
MALSSLITVFRAETNICEFYLKCLLTCVFCCQTAVWIRDRIRDGFRRSTRISMNASTRLFSEVFTPKTFYSFVLFDVSSRIKKSYWILSDSPPSWIRILVTVWFSITIQITWHFLTSHITKNSTRTYYHCTCLHFSVVYTCTLHKCRHNR